MVIKTDIVSALKTAIRANDSVSCPYPDFTNPEQWERYEGTDYRDFQNGEVALIAWQSGESFCNWTFRSYDEEKKEFHRIGGHFYMAYSRNSHVWSQYIIYRYVGGAEDETEIPCPDLEDIL